MDRRTFLITTGMGAAAAASGLVACGGRVPSTATSAANGSVASLPTTEETNKEKNVMTIELPKLPYDLSALEPHISRENLELHYGKHHNAYVTNLNKLIAEGKADGASSLEQIIVAAPDGAVFNNAAQVWNHTFYWNSMKPSGGGAPTGDVAAALTRDFGSIDEFKRQFTEAAISQFGSGWAWLVMKGGKLQVTKTANADLPLKHGETALLTCDVWEHAYYPTYKNLRPKYTEVFLDSLVNWEFVAKNLAAVK